MKKKLKDATRYVSCIQCGELMGWDDSEPGVCNECEDENKTKRIVALEAKIAKYKALEEAARQVLDECPEAAPYPDGPCIERTTRRELVNALAALDEEGEVSETQEEPEEEKK